MIVLLQVLSALIERMGVRVAGVLLIGVGLIEIVPTSVLPEYVTRGLAFIAIGVGLIAFGQKQKKATDLYVASEAEKRIVDKTLPTASAQPVIQREIDKQLTEPAVAALNSTAAARATPFNGTPVDRRRSE